MRTIRIYSSQKLTAESTVTLTGTAARHIAQVLRMNTGDALVLFDGSGDEIPGTIQTAAKNQVVVALGTADTPASESALKISLWHGLCRSSRMDSVVQKATELGVAKIQPVFTEHGIVRLDTQRAAKKTDHWRNVAISACEQSGRAIIPTVELPRSLTECLTEYSGARDESRDESAAAFMFDPAGDAGIGQHLRAARNIVVLTGPEGGFSPQEKNSALAAGFSLVSIGPRVLRTETAPIAALSLLQYLAGDLGNGSEPT